MLSIIASPTSGRVKAKRIYFFFLFIYITILHLVPPEVTVHFLHIASQKNNISMTAKVGHK